MSDLQPSDNLVWDRLFELLFECDETLSDEQVEDELKHAGIDSHRGLREFQAIIEQHRARTQFAQAGDLRASMIEKLRGVVTPAVTDLRGGIRGLIERAFSGEAQVAHFQKLERAHTDADLQTLYEDLTRLAALQEAKDDDGGKAE